MSCPLARSVSDVVGFDQPIASRSHLTQLVKFDGEITRYTYAFRGRAEDQGVGDSLRSVRDGNVQKPRHESAENCAIVGDKGSALNAGPYSNPMSFHLHVFSPAAMAYVARAKRSFVDIADLRKLGMSYKRTRTNAVSSKAILETADARKLLRIEESMSFIDDLMVSLENDRSFVQTALYDLRFAPVATLDDQHMLKLCRSGLMDCETLKANWAAADVIAGLQSLVAQHAVIAVPVGTEERRSLERRIAYYDACPVELPEIKELRQAQRVDMIEDEMDEAQEAVFSAAFGRAEEALDEVQDITQGNPITDMEIGQFAHLLHERALQQQERSGRVAKSITKFYDDILCGDYKKRLSKIECAICLDDCVAAAECSDDACGAGMCVGCFARSIESCQTAGWEGVSMVVGVLCPSCGAALDKRLLQLLPPSAMAMYVEAVAEHATAAANKDRAEVEKNRDRVRFATHRADNLTSNEKLYNLERQVTGSSGDKKYSLYVDWAGLVSFSYYGWGLHWRPCCQYVS